MILNENYKVVKAFEPKTTNTAITSDYVTLKNSVCACVVANLTQAVAHATQISIYQAQDTSGTGAKPLNNNIPIWANEDTASGDSLVRQPDGTSYTVSNTAKNKIVTFHINPAKIDINNGFTCLNIRIGASNQVTNLASAEFILESKYGVEIPA